MTATRIAHPSLADRRAHGVDARIATPPESHAGWVPAADRPDPVALLEEQNTTREPDLVPVRHGRMVVSPFTFYRGAAKIMAADLAGTPTAGLDVQLCGDAHLSNFGAFASPERRLLFDLNDFDETLPGPFEYDVKRMAASFTIAARNNGLTAAEGRSVTGASVRAYREAMARVRRDADHGPVVRAPVRGRPAGRDRAGSRPRPARARRTARRARTERPRTGRPPTTVVGTRQADAELARAAKQCDKTLRKAHTRDSLQALSKLGELVDGRYRIVSQPPVVIPARDLAAAYGMTEDADRDHGARPVPGLPGDPAGRPAAPAGAVRDRRHGPQGRRRRQRRHPGVHRAAAGPRRAGPVVPAGEGGDPVGAGGPPAQEPVPQPRGTGGAGAADDAGRQRHLPRLDQGRAGGPALLLAAAAGHEGLRAGGHHVRRPCWSSMPGCAGGPWPARTPGPATPVAIAEYLGDDDAFDTSITDFSQRYADQNELDYQALVTAIRDGRVPAVEGV